MITAPKRYFIELAYVGTTFHGWQRQSNATSVQQVLEEAMTVVLGKPIWLIGQGRTDTGVHATRFYAHFDFAGELPENILVKLNGFLPADIALYQLRPVIPTAHARFSAKSRSYQYHLHTRKNPFLNGRSMRLYQEPNYELMNEAAALMLEYDDFACFARAGGGQKTTVCKVTEAHWKQFDGGAVFYISANRFLRNMVRSVVGSLLEIGQGKKNAAWMLELLDKKNRSLAGASAPASGLYLVEVAYPDEIWLHEQ